MVSKRCLLVKNFELDYRLVTKAASIHARTRIIPALIDAVQRGLQSRGLALNA